MNSNLEESYGLNQNKINNETNSFNFNTQTYNNSNALLNETQSFLNNNNKTDNPNQIKFEDLQMSPNSITNQKLKIYLTYAFGFCVAAALISFVIALLGIILSVKTVTAISKFLIAFGIISMLIFLFGLWTLNMYIKYLNDESLDLSYKRDLLCLFIYLLIILLFAFFILGTGTIAFKQQAKSYVTALGQNESEWLKVFGELKYSDVDRSLNSINIALGIFAITMTALIILILCFTYCVLHSYLFTQAIVQFFCLIFFILGAISLYIALYADRYKEIVNVHNSMPLWVPLTIVVCAVITIIISIFGYSAILAESKSNVRIFCFISTFFSIIIFACTIYSFMYSYKLQSIFNGKCKEILDMLSEDFLIENAGCAAKYITVKTHEPIDCPKERILIAWDKKLKMIEQINDLQSNLTEASTERQNTPDLMGCYDNQCCSAAYNAIVSKTNYLKLFGAILFLTGLICAIGSYLIYDDIESREKNITNYGDSCDLNDLHEKKFCTFSNIIVFLLVLALIGVIVWAICILPQKPKRDPSSVIPPNPSLNNKVSANLVTNVDLNKTALEHIKVIKEDLKRETEFVEKKDCGSKCPVIRYNFELSSELGNFVRNKTADWSFLIIKQDGVIDDKFVVKFEGGSRVLDTFNQYFEFHHNCPMMPSKIKVKITGEVNPPPTVFIQNQINKNNKLKITEEQNTFVNPNILSISNQTASIAAVPNSIMNSRVIDYSKLNIGERFLVINKTIDYSFVSENSQVIKGKVLKRVDSKRILPIKSAEIKIENLDFPQCNSYTLYSDDNGNFVSPKLYIFNGGMKSKYSITINYPDLTQFRKTVLTGGIGAPAEIDLGNIELWSPSMLELVDISATVLNSIDNTPLEDVKVSIYQGFVNFNNEQIQEKSIKNVNSFLEIRNSKSRMKMGLLGSSNTDDYQYYKFTISNGEGAYKIKELPPNLYTLVFEKEGFYREVLNIEVIGKWTPIIRNIALTPIVEPGKIRVVLSWPDAPSDLDLYSIFKTGNMTKCIVFFGKTVCSQTHLDLSNYQEGKKGAETITIDVLEKYIYTFAVRKYVSTAKDNLAPGEKRVDGAPLSSDYNDENFAEFQEKNNTNLLSNVTLSASKAKVAIFVYGFEGAVQEITIPLSPEGNLLLDSDKDKENVDWWLPFCIDGETGIESLKIVNKLTSSLPQASYCEGIYSKTQTVENTQVASFTEVQAGNKMERNV